MGINGQFKQLSLHLLEKLKSEPGLVRVFTDAKYISLPEILQGKGLFLYQKEFGEVRDDIALVIAEGQNEELEIDKYWHIMHFLLTKDSSMEPCNLPFITLENSDWDNLPLVNVVLGGTTIPEVDRDFTPVRYFMPDEVKQITNDLVKITEDCLRKIFSQSILLNPNVYKILWWEQEENFEENLETLLFIKDDMIGYFQDAVSKSHAILAWLS